MNTSISKRYWKYVSQNVAGALGISCYIIVDTFFISKAAGADGITILNLSLPLYGLVFALGALIGIGSATRYGIERARGSENVNRFFGNAIMWEWIVAVPFMVMGIFFPDRMIQLMGGDTDITRLGVPYFRIFMILSPFFMMQHTITAFIRNDKGTVVAMFATIAGSLFNVLFDYIFMFPMGMGMTGAALATGTAPIVCMLVCLFHFGSKKNTLKLFPLHLSAKDLFHSIGLGVSAFIGEFASAVTTTVFNFIILSLEGNIGVAAYGVIANYAIVVTAMFGGISNGCQPLLSESYGKADHRTERKLLRMGVLTAICLAIISAVITGIFAKPLVRLFNSEQNESLAGLATLGMRLYFPGYLLAGVNIVLIGYFSATEKVRSAMSTSILRGVVAISGFAVLLSALLQMRGVWLSFAAAEGLTLLVASILYFQTKSTK